MNELYKETILSVIITELATFEDVTEKEFILKYENLFAKYTDITKLKEMLEKRMPSVNWKIIENAKQLALDYKDSSEEQENINPLCSIFSNLSLDGTYPEKKMYYAPAKLSMENTIPLPGSRVRDCDYGNVRMQFCEELDRLQQSPPKEFESFLVVLDTLMKKYLWGIPATQNKQEDVSLYDYIKTAVAITVASLKSQNREMPFVLAAGHFSGIQKYIFLVSKVGTGGVAKRLRSRSFYVNAMISALAHCIVHRFEIPLLNILMLTGGKFYILLPNTDDAENILQGIETSVTEYLYNKFKGNLSFELVWEKTADEGILDYSGTITRLSSEIDRKKNQLLKCVLTEKGKWVPENFIIYDDLFHKSMCTACRSALVDAGKEMCSNCENDTEMGAKLPKIKQFSFSRDKGQYELLEGYYLNLDKEAAEPYLIMNLNDSDIAGMYDRPVTMYYAVNNVPVKETGSKGKGGFFEVKTFGEIAEQSKGCKKIGILKADVDTLGFLFSEGLQREDRNAGTIARVNTLSRMLELFFNGCLHEIIAKKYKNVYCVFAGGDDLFLLGPWSEMPELAIEINTKFDEYTAHNPCITLSAAICTSSGNGHISTLAEYCEEKLSQVKKEVNSVAYPDKKGRNGIYFLDEAMRWEEFKIQIKTGKMLSRAYADVGAASIRRLGDYSRMYQDYQKNKDVDNLMFLPMFHYDMERNERMIRKNKEFKKYCDDLYKLASDYKRMNKEVYFAGFSAKYALNLTKEERKYGQITGKISK
nr:type III-A CRISPR-associated protein Cas10/Csm1 [uncultured Schaedlerella sp.]